MDSQSLVDHLRDEAAIRKNTTLGELLDKAAETIDEYEYASPTTPCMVWYSLDGKPCYWDRSGYHIPANLAACNESVWLVPGTYEE